jgi:Uncharacterised nucleotidyltransferase
MYWHVGSMQRGDAMSRRAQVRGSWRHDVQLRMSVRMAALALGTRVAAALAGSWRAVPPRAEFAADGWDATVQRLLETGAGGLGWWLVRDSGLRHVPASEKLHDAYRLHSVQSCVREHLVAQVFDRCRAFGVEPLLAKGWAVARLYPEAGLRPSGDIDLFVRPERRSSAELALVDFKPRQVTVDLHSGFPDLGDRSLDDVWSHSTLRRCGTSDVRITGLEDQLRHLCIHVLRHGAWRPLWLCDVAATVESIDASFDWDYCLRGSRQGREAVACAVGLAHHLLGARVEHTPLADRARCLPRWLVPSVLRQWGRRYGRYTDVPIVSALRRVSTIAPALRRRWPNAVESTMSVRGSFNNVPRLPFQLADCLLRLGKIMVRLAPLGDRR